jgi:hypothetical protein
VLPPAEDPRNPYQVEVVLPPWLLDGDPTLHRWLFSYGGALRLEGYQGLVEEQHQWFKEALAALGLSPAESSLEAPDRCGLVGEHAPGGGQRKQRRTSASGLTHPCPLCGGLWVPLAPLG